MTRPAFWAKLPPNGQKRPASRRARQVMTLVRARKTITEYVQAGLQSAKIDSIVHEYLNVRVTPSPKPIRETRAHLFSVKDAPPKVVGLITGDIRNVKTVDIWVNSENTNMQMARYYDGSISGVIRFMGGKKNESSEVVDDIVGLELLAVMERAAARPYRRTR